MFVVSVQLPISGQPYANQLWMLCPKATGEGSLRKVFPITILNQFRKHTGMIQTTQLISMW